MRLFKVLTSAFLISASTAALAKTSIVVLPPDYTNSKEALARQIVDATTTLKLEDRILFYGAAHPLQQLAAVSIPDDPNSKNPAWLKRKIAEQLRPVLRYVADLPPGTVGEPPGNLNAPGVMDEFGRNIVSSLPEKKADVLLLGSPIYFDSRDGRWSMMDRFYPSDGLIKLNRGETPFGTAGAATRLSGITLHYCWPNGQSEFVSAEHEELVRRYYSVWSTEQGARIGTISYDLPSCFRRLLAGEVAGQTVYKFNRDAKPEMLRARAPIPATVPVSMARPGEYFLRDDVPIATTPPSTTKGILWIGAKWTQPCDVDVWAHGEASSPWLFFGYVRSSEGYFSKDWRSGTGEASYEYVEFTKPIDINTAEMSLNLFSANLPDGPSGIVRAWFDGKVYEAPFKIVAKTGNHGAQPMAAPYWVRIDLKKLLLLPS